MNEDSNSNNANIDVALYLIPVTLGSPNEQVLPSYNLGIIKEIKYFIVENKKTAIRFLVSLSKEIDIDSLTFYELNEHTDLKSIGNYLEPLQKHKQPMGVISEAGCPAVADPGAAVVALAHKKHLKVVPLTGPSSIILSVMASGFNGQSFAFNGYLPVKNDERAKKLRQLESRAWNEDQTQLFIEAPYRNAKMLETIIRVCKKNTMLCIASGLTCQNEFIKTQSVEEWKNFNAETIQKVPAIFLLFKEMIKC